MRLKLKDATPALYEFLVFNRCDQLWVDAWLIHDGSPHNQYLYVLHKVAWHNDDGVLVQTSHVRYRWLRKKSHYRLRLKQQEGQTDEKCL